MSKAPNNQIWRARNYLAHLLLIIKQAPGTAAIIAGLTTLALTGFGLIIFAFADMIAENTAVDNLSLYITNKDIQEDWVKECE